MQSKTRPGFLLLIVALATLVSYAEVSRTPDVLWLDFDMQDIPEPKERKSTYYDDFFKGQLIEEMKQDLDIVRWVRAIAGRPKPALNVNAVDEVPDSSWYTNRHHLRRMTIDELAGGPNQGPGPDFTQATITSSKDAGVTPGLQLKDRKGDSYIVKFDNVQYPELQSAAEMISTKILYAAGYNVPENYIAYIEPDQLQIGDKVEIADATGIKRPLTRENLDEMLRRVAKIPDGRRYRVLASKILSGKAKGPYSQIGIRRDDPNDQIPHEHRRELRGLRVISSWLNHWDTKEDNSLDVYVEEGGRRFLRHYLIDFGSSLGGGQSPMEYFHGRAYLFDTGGMLKETFTLGLHVTPDEKHGTLVSPQVGMFSAEDFDPGHWKSAFPTMPFQNMTREDAFWATRIILSFSEPELRRIVEAGQYSNPGDTEYMLQTLLERRRTIAGHWLREINPIAYFSVAAEREGIALKFHDLMANLKSADPASAEYIYEIKSGRYKSDKRTTRDSSIFVDRQTLGAAGETRDAGAPVEITIWTKRPGSSSDPVTVYLYENPQQGFSIRRISRG